MRRLHETMKKPVILSGIKFNKLNLTFNCHDYDISFEIFK